MDGEEHQQAGGGLQRVAQGRDLDERAALGKAAFDRQLLGVVSPSSEVPANHGKHLRITPAC